MAATVFKGQYYIKTAIGYYVFNYFEGDTNVCTLPAGLRIEANVCSVNKNNLNTTVGLPISINNSTAYISQRTISNDSIRIKDSVNTSQNMVIEDFNPITVAGCSFFMLRRASNNTLYYGTLWCPLSSSYINTVVTLPTPTTYGHATATMVTNNNVGMTSAVPSAFTGLFGGIKPFKPTTDPYSPGGVSDKEGGYGSFDLSSDPVPAPSLPTLSAVDTGFITLFNPSVSDLRSLSSYMWGNPLFDINQYKKILADPMDAILGLSIVPVSPTLNGNKSVTVGNIPTGVSMPLVSSQYVSVDCGTISVNEYWGTYLDYSPHTKCEIFLPYCGIHPINTDDIMGKNIQVVYHVDILSGACVAFIICAGSVLYSFTGQCAISIPVSGNDWTNMINGMLSTAVSLGSMVATGGATAPMALGQIASTVVNDLKPSIERSGSISGGGGLLANQTPFLILTRPRQCLPEFQNEFSGYPSFITAFLGDVSGYTEIHSVRLTGVQATDSEINEIISLLKNGVIL